MKKRRQGSQLDTQQQEAALDFSDDVVNETQAEKPSWQAKPLRDPEGESRLLMHKAVASVALFIVILGALMVFNGDLKSDSYMQHMQTLLAGLLGLLVGKSLK